MNKEEALDKTIQQWQMMVDNPTISKREAYTILGGLITSHSCFLCDYTYSDCFYCIQWRIVDTSKKIKNCLHSRSPYKIWAEDQSKENAMKMLEFLKAAREDLS